VGEREAFAPGVDPRTVAYDMEMYNSGRLTLTPEVRAAMQGLYDGEVAALDRALGRLLDGLETRGYDASTLLVVITADHGESLGESGFVGHLLGLPDRVLRVPLLLVGPGVTPGEVTEPTQLVQLRATLRALLGLEAFAEIATPLPPWGPAPALLITEHPEPRWYLEELRGFNAALDPAPWQGNWVAVERAGTKVVFDEGGRGATYDLRRDPEERDPRPLSDGAELIAAYRQWRAERPNPTPRGLTDETRRALEAIGYLH
jgi:arylsulfatase A-like enzyme